MIIRLSTDGFSNVSDETECYAQNQVPRSKIKVKIQSSNIKYRQQVLKKMTAA